MRWEYKIVSLETTGFTGSWLNAAALEKNLNLLGNEGWEVVSAFDTNRTHGATRDVHVLLKRPA
jgi:hypothetical protein